MTPDPRQVVAGLSEAQKRVILDGRVRTRGCQHALIRRGLATQKPAYLMLSWQHIDLTPLGLACRAILMEQMK